MTRLPPFRRTTFLRDDSGATLVEFALVIGLLLVLIFMMFDFGRIANAMVFTQKGVERVARAAIVSAPVCGSVPTTVQRRSGNSSDPGTLCRSAADPCDTYTVTCTANPRTATAGSVPAIMDPFLPAVSTGGTLTFSYESDNYPDSPRIGFVTGPTAPIVSVELSGVRLTMVSPLAGLLGLVSGTQSTLFQNGFTLPTIRVSLPAEDLQ